MTSTRTTHSPRLGVDIGRVLIGGPGPDGADTSFLEGGLEDALTTPAMPGAFDALARMVVVFGGDVWLISKCGERVQARTRAWLVHNDVAGRTGLDPEKLRFCLRRPEKAIHCSELGITHFIDDRVDVLVAMEGVVAHRFLFGPQRRSLPRMGCATRSAGGRPRRR